MAHFGMLHSDLGGLYQKKNMNTIMIALYHLSLLGFLCESNDPANWEKSRHELAEGLRNVCEHTGLQGRWQVIREYPKVVCDTGHNVAGWQYLSQQLAMVESQQMHIIFGMVDDKDIDGVLQLLPKRATYYFTKADSHRALSETTVKTLATKYGLQGATYSTVREAYSAAMKVASRDSFVFVGGSSYVVGDFLKNCL